MMPSHAAFFFPAFCYANSGHLYQHHQYYFVLGNCLDRLFNWGFKIIKTVKRAHAYSRTVIKKRKVFTFFPIKNIRK